MLFEDVKDLVRDVLEWKLYGCTYTLNGRKFVFSAMCPTSAVVGLQDCTALYFECCAGESWIPVMIDHRSLYV